MNRTHYVSELFERLEHYDEIIDRYEAALEKVSECQTVEAARYIARQTLNEAQI